MAEKADVWMPFFVGDYLSDTQRLSTEQHGAYLLLIFDYWKNGPPPDDDAVLAQAARLPLRAWKRQRIAIERFFRIEGGEWRHKRIDAEREKAAANKEKYRKRAQGAAHARWDASSNATSNATSNGEAMLPLCTSTSSSPISNEIEGTANAVSSAEPTLKPEHVVEAWNAMASRLGLAQVKKLTRERKQRLQARIRENTVEDFKAALLTIENSAFLRGEGRSGWKADFDFFLQKSSFTKLSEGTYVH